MVATVRMTINRLANFSRRFGYTYSGLNQFELERQAYALREKLQHLRRTKSIGLLIGMLRDAEGRRPISSSKMDRVMINLREIATSFSSTQGGGVEQKLFGQPAIESIFLLSQFVKDKSIFR